MDSFLATGFQGRGEKAMDGGGGGGLDQLELGAAYSRQCAKLGSDKELKMKKMSVSERVLSLNAEGGPGAGSGTKTLNQKFRVPKLRFCRPRFL